ncbi:uncharacterized protein LACBIDRAFT_324474 [Laccaria bicolor S238N-H82]|uniref:Predicted protein n=1 Tax=Laccaria bicolor (strain S238N-H82 / ATCC MYA-4686) TaxID=486041 RepID=B0D1X9_LACBS|nr:uncharacterized protein LACBIDRAFT_324474 [Laccaria bicolor S238N-H82]EDR12070.1 predicted protein [Laccaria bicolor S238N-H82]|eukprot:XP_001877967.1 predicted protein [Laccaria bicolor S238N-H82]
MWFTKLELAAFWACMDESDGVIGGCAAINAIIPLNKIPHLDVFVPKGKEEKWDTLLLSLGWDHCFSDTHFARRYHALLRVTSSTSSTSILPIIFSASHTAEMTFITSSDIYAVYPDLTQNRRTVLVHTPNTWFRNKEVRRIVWNSDSVISSTYMVDPGKQRASLETPLYFTSYSCHCLYVLTQRGVMTAFHNWSTSAFGRANTTIPSTFSDLHGCCTRNITTTTRGNVNIKAVLPQTINLHPTISLAINPLELRGSTLSHLFVQLISSAEFVFKFLIFFATESRALSRPAPGMVGVSASATGERQVQMHQHQPRSFSFYHPFPGSGTGWVHHAPAHFQVHSSASPKIFRILTFLSLFTFFFLFCFPWGSGCPACGDSGEAATLCVGIRGAPPLFSCLKIDGVARPFRRISRDYIYSLVRDEADQILTDGEKFWIHIAHGMPRSFHRALGMFIMKRLMMGFDPFGITTTLGKYSIDLLSV